MFSNIRIFVVMVVLTIFASLPVQAQTDLQDVIDKYCRKDCVSAEKLTDVVTRVSKSYKLDVNAVLAIIHVESKYHIKAKNGSSVGLSQVLLRYHKPKFLGKNYYDVEDNVFAGMQVLRDCLKRTKGNYDKAFGCYNGGGDKNYVSKVRKVRAMMKEVNKPEIHPDPLARFLSKWVKVI